MTLLASYLSPQALAEAKAEKLKRQASGQDTSSARNWNSLARPKQLPPEGDWRIWLILAGRGFGKTRTIVEWAHGQAKRQHGSRGALISATAADARDILMEGESGLKTLHPEVVYEPSKRRVSWPNGSTATLFSADEPDRLRGPQFHWAVCDELAVWRYPRAFDMLMLGLRLGDDPRCAIATTPRPVRHIKEIMAWPTTVTIRGNTYENRDNLAPAFFEQIVRRYEGTRLGRQEINAEILDDVPGALWTRALLDANRVTYFPHLTRVVVGVDPEATSGEESAETGIVTAALGSDGEVYVLDDASLRDTPHGWAKASIAALNKFKGDRIIGEINNGGEMVEYTLRTIDVNVPFTAVHASRNKQARAEPVAALYEQGRVHHVGIFADLEDQMCSWVPGEKSPDRIDALVWAVTDLMGLMLEGEAYGESVYAQPYRISASDY